MVERHALLIGVPCYDDDAFNDRRLADAVRADVSEMRAALAQSDYAITECGTGDATYGDATLNRINQAIEEACANAPADGVLLIYFSGHGVTIKGTDYLVPRDAYRSKSARPGTGQNATPSAVTLASSMPAANASASQSLARADRPPVRVPGPPNERSLVRMVPDIEILRECRARLVVFFIDACRNDPASDKHPSASRAEEPPAELPYLGPHRHVVLVTGCGAGQVCQYDETGSTFTQDLAKVLDPRHPARTLGEVVSEVTKDMTRRSRLPQGEPQEPVVRHPELLKAAADVEVCEGHELAAAWRKAIDASPLLTLCPDQDRVRQVVAECARCCTAAHDVLLQRTGLEDPWTDQGYPVRVLRNTELLLRNSGFLPLDTVGPRMSESASAAPALRGSGSSPADTRAPGDADPPLAEAPLLIAAPFLREAALAVGIRDAAGIDPASLDRTWIPGSRSDLELTHEMHQHLVRRAVALRQLADAADSQPPGAEAKPGWQQHAREDDLGRTSKPGSDPAESRGTASSADVHLAVDSPGAKAADQLAMWLVHRWLAGQVKLWEAEGVKKICALATPMVTGDRGGLTETEAMKLVQALLPAVGAEPTDERLLARLTGKTATYVTDSLRFAAATLWLAGIMAVDPRRLPPVVADLVGTRMELPITDVKDAAGRRAEWARDSGDGLGLRLVCEHPALHDAFDDIVKRAAKARETIHGRLGLPPALEALLPRTFTAAGLRPATMTEDGPAYEVPLARFQIAEEKVRELLMGRQLYGEPGLAIRELYQNALDACRWRATRHEYLRRKHGDNRWRTEFRDLADWTGLIRFTQGTDEGNGPFIECEDNGVGMDLDTLKHVFANAGERFVYGQDFRAEQADWENLDDPLRMVPNSQFGVGVFSYFMLSDEITVVTRHQARDGEPGPEAHEVRIASSGSLIQISRIPAGQLHGELRRGGTRVRLYLSGDAKDISVLETLRDFLWLADYRVEVTAPDGHGSWEPGKLRYVPDGEDPVLGRAARRRRQGRASSFAAEAPDATEALEPLKCGTDLWWVHGAGGLAADGIRTSTQMDTEYGTREDWRSWGLVVNLHGEHRPQFTVDRKTLLRWDEDWVASQVDAALPDLMKWPGFTLSWLWNVARGDAGLAQRLYEHAVAAGLRVMVGGKPVLLSAAGCVYSDAGCLDTFLGERPSSGGRDAHWFQAWRMGVWRNLGYDLAGRPGSYAPDYVTSARTDGFPIPDPIDGMLLESLAGEFRHSPPSLDDVLDAIAGAGCTLRAGLRRARRYAVTGVNLRAARRLSALDISVNSRESALLLGLVRVGFDLPAARSFIADGISMNVIDDQDLELLQKLAPWPPARVPEARDLVAALLRAAGTLRLPFAEVMRRAQRLAIGLWPGPEPDLARVVADVFPDADRITEILSPATIVHWMDDGVQPSSLARQVSSLGWPLCKVLELLDELASLGVTIPSLEAYPADLDAIELAALKGIGTPGGMLGPLEIVQIAAEAGKSVGAVHQALTRLVERGLLALPALDGPADFVPTREETDLLANSGSDSRVPRRRRRSGASRMIPAAGWAPPWLRITQLLTLREVDAGVLRAARALIPFTTPEAPIPPPLFVELAYQLKTSLAGAADALRAVYPAAQLPEVDSECADLTVSVTVHDALLEFNAGISWRLGPLPIIEGALRAGRPLGDFLGMLDPFRRLGAPVPPFDKAIRDTLNKVTIDAYDLDMLLTDDERGIEIELRTITALTLVQAVGRLGLTLREAHARLARLVPTGLTLDYPHVGFPDEIVRWQDLLLLTTYFDGQPPAISGTIDQAYLQKAAEEIFDDPPHQTAEHAAWLRERLKLYAPLFQLEIAEETASASEH